MNVPVSTGGTVVLDGNGAGTVTVGPTKAGQRWQVIRYTTTGASATEPHLAVSRASADVIDTTLRGNGDTSEWTNPVVLWAGESLTFTYTGGTPGAAMTVYLEGTTDTGAA